jgi:nucleoside-diphosphate-sugar epimerase
MADIRGKKILVIGGAGFIGSHMVDQLLKEDVEQVIVYDNFARGVRGNLENALTDPRVRIFEVLEACLGRGADKEFLPMQTGDVPATWADANALDEAMGYRPSTTVKVGVRRFVEWYREFYGVAAPAVAACAGT